MSDVMRTLIFDRVHTLLAEIEPVWDALSWRLNGVGKARGFMPYTDPKCAPDLLAYGNRVLVQFANGMPDWGGVIDLPRRREAEGVTFTAYTGEKLLDWRVTVKGRYFNQQAPGYVAQALISEENAIWPTGLTMGSMYMGGTARTLEYHYHDLLARIQDLQRLTGFDFAVIPVYAGGTLRFEVNWYEVRGRDATGDVVLREGDNVGRIVLDEQGPLASRILLAGSGSTWGDERLTSVVEDAASRELYGYREWAEVQSGVKTQTTLDANAAALLAEMRVPRSAYGLQGVLNRAPGLYADYGVGDSVRLQGLFESGAWDPVDTEVRVIAREWSPASGCALEVV